MERPVAMEMPGRETSERRRRSVAPVPGAVCRRSRLQSAWHSLHQQNCPKRQLTGRSKALRIPATNSLPLASQQRWLSIWKKGRDLPGLPVQQETLPRPGQRLIHGQSSQTKPTSRTPATTVVTMTARRQSRRCDLLNRAAKAQSSAWAGHVSPSHLEATL